MEPNDPFLFTEAGRRLRSILYATDPHATFTPLDIFTFLCALRDRWDAASLYPEMGALLEIFLDGLEGYDERFSEEYEKRPDIDISVLLSEKEKI